MLYRNKKTGAIIEVASECGGDWEAVKVKSEPKEKKEKKEKK